MAIPTIGINSIVERQTKDSPFSYCEQGFDYVVHLAKVHFHLAKPGYRDGVILVPVPATGFWTSDVELQEGDQFEGKFVPRIPGEAPRREIWVKGKGKQPAKTVWVVLYRHDVLAEDKDAQTDCEWEMVSINASPTWDTEPSPMNVGTLLANHFHVEGSDDGGTKTKMSAAEFVEELRRAYVYWKNKAKACPKEGCCD